MKIVNKINLDSPTITSEHASWKYAKNVQISEQGDYTETEDGLETISGVIHADNAYLGKIVIPDDVVLFYYNDVEKELQIFTLNRPSDIIIIKDERYKDTKIIGEYTYNYKGELIITFGCKSDKLIIPEILLVNFVENIGKIINTTSVIYNNLLLYPNWYEQGYPQFALDSITKDGNLYSGTYFISLCYEDGLGNRSDYSGISNKIIITENNKKSGINVGKSINVNTSNLNTNFKYYRLAVLYYSDTTLKTIALTNKISTSVDYYSISDISNLDFTSLEDILINNVKYSRAESIVSNQNKLLLYNVKTETNHYNLLQKAANNININSIISPKTLSDPFELFTLDVDELSKEVYERSSFKSGEPYLFYINWKSKKGDTVAVNYIPYNELSNMRSFDLGINYDLDFPELEGTEIKTYRFPELYIHGGLKSIVRRYGIQVNNVIVPDELKDVVSGWEICYAERTLANTYSLGQSIVFNPVSGISTNENIHIVYNFNLQYLNINLDRITKLKRVLSSTELIIVDNINPYKARLDKRHNLSLTLGPIPTIPSNNYYPGDVDRSEFISIEYVNHTASDTYDVDDRIEIHTSKVMNGVYEIIINENPYRGGILNNILVSTGIINKGTQADIFGGDIVIAEVYHRQTSNWVGIPLNTVRSNTNKIIQYWIESSYLPQLRHEGQEEYQKVYPTSTWDEIYNMPKDKGSYINDAFGNSYDLSYSKINNIQNPIVDEKEYESEFKNRIAISDVNSSESTSMGWRVFRANNYYDIDPHRGEGVKLISADKQLYIQNRYGLFLAQIKDVLQLADGNQAYLGTGDLFDRPPQEILYDKNGGIGCKDYDSALFTPLGYVVADRDYAAIYTIGDEANELTRSGFRTWFKEFSNIDNNNIINIEFDRERKRLLINANGEVASYSILTGGLASFHDYNYIDIAANRKGLYLIESNNIKEFVDKPTSYPSFIDINFIYEPAISKLFQSIIWETEYLDKDKQLLWNKTIDKLMVYSDSQCTGLLDVNKGKMWYDNKTGVHVSGKWFFNDLFDAVLDNNKPILSDQMPTSNVNINKKNWFDKSQIISKFITIRLHSDNMLEQRIRFINLFVELTKDAR